MLKLGCPRGTSEMFASTVLEMAVFTQYAQEKKTA